MATPSRARSPALTGPLSDLVDALVAMTIEDYLASPAAQQQPVERERPNPAPLPAPPKAA